MWTTFEFLGFSCACVVSCLLLLHYLEAMSCSLLALVCGLFRVSGACFVIGRSFCIIVRACLVIGRALCVHYFLLCVLCCSLTAAVGIFGISGLLGSLGIESRCNGNIFMVVCSQKFGKFI